MRRLAVSLLLVCSLCACGQVPAPKPPALSVQLTWAPGPDGVHSFNVYRNGGLLFGPTPLTAFDDTATQPGVQYCYFVTALADGKESQPSNSICLPPQSAAITATVTESDAPVLPGDKVIPAYHGAQP